MLHRHILTGTCLVIHSKLTMMMFFPSAFRKVALDPFLKIKCVHDSGKSRVLAEPKDVIFFKLYPKMSYASAYANSIID